MDPASRKRVRDRAAGRCEYCGIAQRVFAELFQIEHIVAISHGDDDTLDNTCAACRRCNLHKGPNLSGIDPLTGLLTRLFHPRQDSWHDHFEQLPNGILLGLTDIGRTTVAVLAMNADRRVELRRAMHLFDHPDG